jgi:hypothetical protein
MNIYQDKEFVGFHSIHLSVSHRDGPIYENMVASISLESSVMITFSRDKFSEKNEHFSFILEPRSLIVFTDEIYEGFNILSSNSKIFYMELRKMKNLN